MISLDLLSRNRTRAAFAVVIATLFSGALLAQQPPADNNPRKPGGFLANAGANCRGLSFADDQALSGGTDGLLNASGVPRVVVCNQYADIAARYSGNGTPNVSGISSISIVFRSFSQAAEIVSCTGYAGVAGGPQFSLNKSVTVPPNGKAPIHWSAATDNGGVPFQVVTNISCTIPNNIQVNENYNRYFHEVGDFSPLP